jgi:hypothetical protein
MKAVTNERRFNRLRSVLRAPAPMRHRPRNRAPSAHATLNWKRFCREWLALRAWEDDGGRVVQTWPAAADESRRYVHGRREIGVLP